MVDFQSSALRAFMLVFLAGVMIALGSACRSGDSAEDVSVVQPRLVKSQSGQRAFMGVLVNDRDASISMAQIEVALYDDDGSEVENILIELSNIPARDSVSFSKEIDSDRAFRQAQVQRILTP